MDLLINFACFVGGIFFTARYPDMAAYIRLKTKEGADALKKRFSSKPKP